MTKPEIIELIYAWIIKMYPDIMDKQRKERAAICKSL